MATYEERRRYLTATIPDMLQRDDIVSAMFFLAKGEHNYFVDLLYSYRDDEVLFRQFVDRLADDARMMQNTPEFITVMKAIWREHIKGSEATDPPTTMPTIDNTALTVYRSAICNFAQVITHLPPDQKLALIKSIGNHSTIIKFLSRSATPLIAAVLAAEALYSIYRWLAGEISGKLCAKKVIDSAATAVGGLAAGAAGAAVGTAVAPGVGTVVGAVVGGVAGALATKAAVGALTEKIFALTPAEAVAEAYRFMGLSPNCTNDEVNAQYRTLATLYHPSNGGSEKKWHDLQIALHIISSDNRGCPPSS